MKQPHSAADPCAGSRRDAASALRQCRKTGRRRSHRRRRRFVSRARITPVSNRCPSSVRNTRAGAAIIRHAPEVRFSARRAGPPPRVLCAVGCRSRRREPAHGFDANAWLFHGLQRSAPTYATQVNSGLVPGQTEQTPRGAALRPAARYTVRPLGPDQVRTAGRGELRPPDLRH